MDKELTVKLDDIIALLKAIAKPQPMWTRIANGILGAIEIIRTWIEG